MKQTSSLTQRLTDSQVQHATRESNYARIVAAEFGWKAGIAASCVTTYPDNAIGHAANAYDYARLAAHFARKVAR